MNKTLGLLFAAVLFSGCALWRVKNPWAQVQAPAPGTAEAIGGYANGCARGSVALDLSGPGYEVMRPSRRRFYGNPKLVAFLKDLAAKATAANLNTLMIGDLGMPRGGPTLSAHASHQTGLDVDIWYRQQPAGKTLTNEERETLETPSMVTQYFGPLNAAWNPNEIEILKLAASSDGVDRIFVNPSIKKHICELHRGEAWVARLRPWWGHDDHFHVRLQCPTTDKLCVNRADPIPPGDSCDATLDDWFSDKNKAKEKDLAENSKPSAMPKLPPECQAVLNADVGS